MKTIKFIHFSIITLILSVLFSCSDNDDNTKPITLKNQENTTISLRYPYENKYNFSLEGGDGNYSVTCSNSKIATVEKTSASDFDITTVGIGEASITITDNSQNTLVLKVIVDYLTHKFIIVKHDIKVVGGDLTENEKKAIKEKYLAEIPVKVGGGYQFIYTNAPNDCKAIIYKDIYGSKGIETIFTKKELKNTQDISAWGYEITINNEKRLFVLQRYTPSTRSDVTMALEEDITEKVKKEYPKAELVLTSQVIDIPKQ